MPIAIVVFFEGIVLTVSYLSQNESLFKWTLLVFIFQAVLFLFAIPFVLVSVVMSRWRQEINDVQHVVMIWIWREKAYLPTLSETNPGYFVDVEPVQIADLTQPSLANAMKRVIEAGYQHELLLVEGMDPLLAVTQMNSRETLKQESIVFIVKWTAALVELELVEAKKNIHQKLQSFPREVSLDTISKVVLTVISR